MLYAGFSMQPFKKTDVVGNPIYSFLCQLELFLGDIWQRYSPTRITEPGL